MGPDAPLAPEDFAPRIGSIGAAVPTLWLRRLLAERGSPRWLPKPAGVGPLCGRPVSAQAWSLLVFRGLLSACGGRVASARGRALVFDLAAAAVPVPIRGALARRPVPEELHKAMWARQQLRGSWPGEDAAACLFALESCGALAETPEMVEQARWRLGPGVDATDAQAIGSLVADVLWHCREDAQALLREIAARIVRVGR